MHRWEVTCPQSSARRSPGLSRSDLLSVPWCQTFSASCVSFSQSAPLCFATSHQGQVSMAPLCFPPLFSVSFIPQASQLLKSRAPRMVLPETRRRCWAGAARMAAEGVWAPGCLPPALLTDGLFLLLLLFLFFPSRFTAVPDSWSYGKSGPCLYFVSHLLLRYFIDINESSQHPMRHSHKTVRRTSR